mmetsp:Transcript_68372/g.196113  ORF Transcript_68372/g.196113 Transcript_68372/m.196113 type:complete len:167 (-) Transcript_68372:180-680(-)
MVRLLAGVALFVSVAFGPQAAEAVKASRVEAVRKMVAAKNLAAAGLPDPTCATGVISLKDGDAPQACCAGYCGECSDYPTCTTVRGQNSTFACCKSQVLKQECGKGSPANVCLKKCAEAVPPCIMEDGKIFSTPEPSARTAGTDCNEAVSVWRARADEAVNPPASA